MSNVSSQIEAILLVANKAVSLKELSSITGLKNKELITKLDDLSQEYLEKDKGWRLINVAGNYQLVSSGQHSEIVKKFLKSENNSELSQPSLETLTIIAYRGPIHKIELERIRGVNCSLIIRNLLIRGLIEESFDKNKNENYYQVTLDFLRFLNLNSIKDLPDYDRLNQAEELDQVLAENINP